MDQVLDPEYSHAVYEGRCLFLDVNLIQTIQTGREELGQFVRVGRSLMDTRTLQPVSRNPDISVSPRYTIIINRCSTKPDLTDIL